MELTEAGRLLERERELDELSASITSATGGAGGSVMIEGEAGIGKTALLAATRELALDAGMMVLSARAGELEHEFAWGVVRQLFDRAVGRAAEEDRDRLLRGAAALARPSPWDRRGRARTRRCVLRHAPWSLLAFGHALPDAANAAVDRRPALGDWPSLRFVAHMLPRILDLPILLVIASRPIAGEATPGHELGARISAEPWLRWIRPRDLTAAATARLVREYLSDVNDEVCSECHALSGGNPFLVRSLLTQLGGTNADQDSVTADHVRRITPAAVSTSVLLTLARLPEGATSFARAVAILGVSAPFHSAQRLAGLGVDEAARAAGDLIRAGILVEDDDLAFVHPLVRSVVYSDVAGPERGRWHRRAAQLLSENGAEADRVAAQLIQSTPSGDAWTVELLRQGAADAAGRGAADVAARYLGRALAEPPGDDARTQLLYELGQIELTHDPAASANVLRDALQDAADSTRRAEIALALGAALTLLGRLTDAVEVLDAGVDAIEDRAASSELSSSLEAARLSATRWEPATQARRRELAEGVRKRAAAGERIDAALHAQLAIEAAAEGTDRERAVRHARAALSAPDAGATATSALPEAMLVLVFADLAGDAAVAVDRWLAVARAQAQPLAVALGATVATLECLYRGAVTDAVANSLDAITVTEGADMQLAPVTVAFLVEALTERGELERATQN